MDLHTIRLVCGVLRRTGPGSAHALRHIIFVHCLPFLDPTASLINVALKRLNKGLLGKLLFGKLTAWQAGKVLKDKTPCIIKLELNKRPRLI